MAFCRVCGKSEEEVGPLSQRGKCAADGDRLVLEAIEQVRSHSGPVFQRWRQRSVAAFGGTIPEPSPRPAASSSSPEPEEA